MAVTSTTIVIPPQVFGYSTVGGAFLKETNAPRGEVVFNAINEDITIAGAGNEQFLQLQMTPPANFTYALVDFCVTLASATDISDWEPAGAVIMNERRATAPNFNYNLVADSGNVSEFLASMGTNSVRSYCLDSPPKGLFSPSQDFASANIIFSVANLVQAGEAAKVTTYIRLLQYDVSQHHSVSVNLPTLTR